MNDTKFEARNPDYEAITRDGFSRHGLMTHLGVEMATVEPGFVELRADYRPELTQQHGYFRGGLMGAMADTACGYAAFSLTPPGATVLTVEYKMNMTAPGEGEQLMARGWVKRPGRTLIVTHGDVFVIKDDIETLCATMLQTIMVMLGSGSRPAG
jgi:uncharacterized protein (TIGR00369 family)